MKHLNTKTLFTGIALIILTTLTQSCSTDVGGNEDNTKPSVALTSLNDGEEVIGDFTITWETNELNKSTVEIHLSYDSGATFKDEDISLGEDTKDIVDGEAINADDGSFEWKTNDIATLRDCRTCRIRITSTDIVGNVSESAESNQDFIINNIPQV